MSGVILREANKNDTNQLVTFANEAYWSRQKVFLQDEPESLRTNKDEIHTTLEDPNKTLFLLVDSIEKIAGSILYDRMGDKKASFGLFAISPEPQFKGLGEQLVRFVEDKAKDEGREEIVIEVISIAKNLISYYERLGYQQTGDKHPFDKVSKAKLKPSFDALSVHYAVLRKSLLD